jgi:AcrR family transcriptional regulator
MLDTPPVNPSATLNRHERRRLHTHNLLIRTTLQLILEKGYDAISIQDITDRADLGRGTFYLHFRDKGDLVWTAFRDSFQRLEQEAHQQLDRRLPQVEYYGLLNIFCHAEKNRDLYRVMFGGQGSGMLTARVQNYLANAFLFDIRNAPVSPDMDFNIPHEVEAQMLTGLISRLLFWWLEIPNSYTPEQMAAMTYKVLYRKNPPSSGV